MLVETLASSLAARLVQNHAGTLARDVSARAAQAGLDRRRLTRVLDYIGANLEDDLTLARLAAVACLSRFHFSRAFKAAVGRSPHHYVSAKRLELAKQLLGKGGPAVGPYCADPQIFVPSQLHPCVPRGDGADACSVPAQRWHDRRRTGSKMTTVEQPTRSRIRSVGVSTRSDTPSTMKKSEHDTRAKTRRHHRSVARHRRTTVASLSAHRLSSDRKFSFNE